jgi:hypothetical protein
MPVTHAAANNSSRGGDLQASPIRKAYDRGIYDVHADSRHPGRRLGAAQFFFRQTAVIGVLGTLVFQNPLASRGREAGRSRAAAAIQARISWRWKAM